jgi:hypothetical protein
LVAAHAGEVVEELVERAAGFEVVQESLDRDSCTDEDGSAAQDLRVAVDDRGHAQRIPDRLPTEAGFFHHSSGSKLAVEKHPDLFQPRLKNK